MSEYIILQIYSKANMFDHSLMTRIGNQDDKCV